MVVGQSRTFGDLSSLFTLGSSLILLVGVDVGLVVEEIALLGSVVGRDEFFVRHIGWSGWVLLIRVVGLFGSGDVSW